MGEKSEKMNKELQAIPNTPTNQLQNVPQQQIMVQSTIDITAIVRENHLLGAEKTLLQTQLQAATSKYEALLESEVKDKRMLQDKVLSQADTITELKKLNESLKQEVANLTEELAKLQEELKKNTSTTKRLAKESRINHGKLLLGSIGYNFIDCAVLFVFRGDFKKNRKQYRTMRDIEQAHKDTTTEARWTEFQEKYYTEDLEEVITEFTGDRLSIAHPIGLQESETVATPVELQNVIKEVYNNRSSENIRKEGCKLVDILDQLSRQLGRDLLV